MPKHVMQLFCLPRGKSNKIVYPQNEGEHGALHHPKYSVRKTQLSVCIVCMTELIRLKEVMKEVRLHE